MIEILSREELVALTARKQPAKIAEQLASQGFSFRWGADGYPKLDREHYQSMMNPSALSGRRRREPNFDAIRRRG